MGSGGSVGGGARQVRGANDASHAEPISETWRVMPPSSSEISFMMEQRILGVAIQSAMARLCYNLFVR